MYIKTTLTNDQLFSLIKTENNLPLNNNDFYHGNGCESNVIISDSTVFKFPMSHVVYKKLLDLVNFSNYIKNYISIKTPVLEIIESTKLGSYFKYEKIGGKHWNLDEYESKSYEEKDLFAQDLARFYFEMHQIPIPKAGYKTKPDMLISANDAEENIKRLFDKDLHSDILKALNLAEYLAKKSKTISFIHGDIQGNNLLISNDFRLNGVLDFYSTNVQDIHFEFQQLRRQCGKDLFNRVKSYYEEYSGITLDPFIIDIYEYSCAIRDTVNFYFCEDAISWSKENREIQRKNLAEQTIHISNLIKNNHYEI